MALLLLISASLLANTADVLSQWLHPYYSHWLDFLVAAVVSLQQQFIILIKIESMIMIMMKSK